jgi:2-oxoglutarate ferredoxin oxidoreductase subunit alpha
VSGKNLFPSNIAGLPTWYTIRANHRGYIARKKEIDFLVAMNPETAQDDVLSLEPGRAVVYDEPLKLDALRSDLMFYPVPFDKIVAACARGQAAPARQEHDLRRHPAELLSIELGEMEKALASSSARSRRRCAEHGRARGGKKYAAEHLDEARSLRVARMNKTPARCWSKAMPRGDGLHVRRRHRRRLVSDHAVVVAAPRR